MPNHTVLIVDDHPLVIAGCRAVLARQTSLRVITAEDYASGLKSFDTFQPEVTIIDVNLPDVSGFELLRSILKRSRDAAVIMLSMNDDPSFAVRAIELGARGFLSKNDDPALLLPAIRDVIKGEQFLAPGMAKSIAFSSASIRANPATQLGRRELEIVKRLGKGDRIGEIADALGISYKTVANTTSLLKKKFGARSHADLIRMAIDLGLA